jgi:undecaprenyl pyrophosphate phosphatase UppP
VINILLFIITQNQVINYNQITSFFIGIITTFVVVFDIKFIDKVLKTDYLSIYLQYYYFCTLTNNNL